jgi:energy-coupling factor transporter ATP-binding protein EcfA2
VLLSTSHFLSVFHENFEIQKQADYGSMTQQPDLKFTNYHGFQVLQSESLGLSPYFSNTLQHRINRKMATNVVFTGEPGIGKSYMAISLARVLEGKTAEGKDRFTVDQVIFTYSEFMELVLRLKSGKIIVFDEPSYAIGKREWYKELNQALTKTIESFRFKVHPLFLPVVNKSLLDKTVREYLIQYQVNVYARGKGTVYKLAPSQFQDKTFHEYFCELHYRQFDMKQCKETNGQEERSSCLGCECISSCQVFRAQYERKKAEIQDSRYEAAKEQAETVESKIMGISELETMAIELKDQWLIDGKPNVQRLRIALRDTHGVQVSLNRAYQLKAALEAHNKEIFDS